MNTGLTDTDIQSIVVDPANNSTVYAGTLSKGVFKTTNGGTSWTAVKFGSDEDVCHFPGH